MEIQRMVLEVTCIILYRTLQCNRTRELKYNFTPRVEIKTDCFMNKVFRSGVYNI